jgi:hypothetical protein
MANSFGNDHELVHHDGRIYLTGDQDENTRALEKVRRRTTTSHWLMMIVYDLINSLVGHSLCSTNTPRNIILIH